LGGNGNLAPFLGEYDLVTTNLVADLVVAIGDLAGHDGGGDAGAKALAIEGRPSAFGLEGVWRDVGFGVGVDQYDIAPVTFAEESALLNAEQLGGCVAGSLHYGFEGEDAVAPKL
jgi:hypothetical protein